MKKALALILALALSASLLVGCGGNTASSASQAKGTELTVVTSYGGDDGNRQNYLDAVANYEQATGNKIMDASATSNEEWKAKVMTDFQTGSEPDVLFYFNGVDSNPLVEGNKVVSIEEIRAEYPDYASNMKDSAMGPSPVDGKNYSVPVNGYWEGLFCNKTVLEAAGVEIPGADYTWDQFLADCEKIKEAGYTPIAVSLQDVPHYWFEFTNYNNIDDVTKHNAAPQDAEDAMGKVWQSGMEDLKELYEKGYLPKNTLTASDADTMQLMADDEAAFAIDGTWKINWFLDNGDPENFVCTYVPAKGERQATDIVGGLSMGYYITRKAWDDPAKREAAVEFVSAMTTDEVVAKFGATSVTALKNGTPAPDNADALTKSALVMTKGATYVAGAAQDNLPQEARNNLFANIKNVVTGNMTSADAITECLALIQ